MKRIANLKAAAQKILGLEVSLMAVSPGNLYRVEIITPTAELIPIGLVTQDGNKLIQPGRGYDVTLAKLIRHANQGDCPP